MTEYLRVFCHVGFFRSWRREKCLTIAEKILCPSPEGAARVQEFHWHCFANSSDELRQEIKPITGVEGREATTELETTTGTVVQVF